MEQAHKWVHSSIHSSMPPHVVPGGNDVDGSTIYVGRSFHNGDMLVAKVIPSKHIAFVSWRGEEIPKDHFEMLCGQNLVWRHCYDHVIPENAVLCGKTGLGQPVYIGRGYYEGSLTVGKVSSVHRALFIPFKGVEHRLETYEILVEENSIAGWAVESPTYPPPPPNTKTKLYPPPMDVKPPPNSETKLYPPPMDVKPSVVDIKLPLYTPILQPPSLGLLSNPFCPPAPFEPPPPYMPMPQPMPLPPIASVEQYCSPLSRDMWMVASANYMPPKAVHAGHDTDHSMIFVSRAFHGGHLVSGKAIPCRACAYIGFAGQEILKTNFEILVGNGYRWVQAQDGNVAPGAVEAGRTDNGEPLFVGRAHYCGSLTPGKIQCSHHCLYIPFGGSERRITNYEVLVRQDDVY